VSWEDVPVVQSTGNLAITILRLSAAASIATALRYHDSARPATPNHHELLKRLCRSPGYRPQRENRQTLPLYGPSQPFVTYGLLGYYLLFSAGLVCLDTASDGGGDAR
jgi:hypothetical protein